MSNWESQAVLAESIFGVYVDWNERFYICPECGEPVYDNDWTEEELSSVFCPICGYLDLK